MDLKALRAQAVALHRAGDLEGAEARYNRIARLTPKEPVTYRNLAMVRRARGDLAGAEQAYRRLEALGALTPPLQWDFGQLLLTMGRYAEAWPFWEVRGEIIVKTPTLSYPEWRGEPLDGKSLLVWFEQGLGDYIQFFRFAIALSQHARITVLCPPALGRLFEGYGPAVIVAEGQVDIPRHDYWCLAGSLPSRLGVTVETIPSGPYLSAQPRPGGGVGVVARGNPKHANDARRSLDPAAAERLMRLGRSLDPSVTGARDFQDTAEIVAGLDLVVTVDTSVAHLAGALGKPVWILLPAVEADWRWLTGRADSPWYASARLFRQATPGDWQEVLDRVEHELAGLGLT